ncbi:hypothetical protein Tdes44962_MAKER08416 [Teratosphaeria destructans]|uniref:Uncharacterized protein n=1 Tax=Teratosphaeria destructans TaxID=418781 RepID=A0A9W7SWS4_9PEZI|nr:hypothetical protein Tdes44962_MAKER08416 [Teratosphaeria destructans]
MARLGMWKNGLACSGRNSLERDGSDGKWMLLGIRESIAPADNFITAPSFEPSLSMGPPVRWLAEFSNATRFAR